MLKQINKAGLLDVEGKNLMESNQKDGCSRLQSPQTGLSFFGIKR
jgi:hypothetical protein